LNPIVRPEVAAGPRGLASPATALVLGGFTLLEVALGGVLVIVARDPRAAFDGMLLVVVLAVAGVGLVVALHQSANPIGWLLLGAAGFFALYGDAAQYLVLDYRRNAGGLPFGRAAFVAEPSWTVGMLFLGLAVFLFPDGRIESARWRRVLYVYLAAGVWFYVVWSVSQATLHLGPDVRVDGVGNYAGSQRGFSEIAGGAAWLAAPLLVVFWFAFIVRKAATWRRARGERRKQLTWLMSGGIVMTVSIVVTSGTNVGGERVVRDVAALGIAAMPVGIGIGILKYRLYEIDRLISRTLSYAILTGLLVLVFFGIVVLTTDVLPFSSPVGVAASTLAAAALFNPLRRRVQHAVDRRFNRARYDAEAIVTAFTVRLRDAIDLYTVRGELLHAVDRAVEPSHASLWIRPAVPGRGG
jgi:hypothetical protein